MSAELKSLILCDFAQIREGLLFVQSGGLTRLAAPTFPAKFACHVATLVWLPPNESGAAHEIVMKVKSAATAKLTATVNVGLHESAAPSALRPGEGRQVPIVVPLGAVSFPVAGEYDLQVEVDGEFAGDISFVVAQRVWPNFRRSSPGDFSHKYVGPTEAIVGMDRTGREPTVTYRIYGCLRGVCR